MEHFDHLSHHFIADPEIDPFAEGVPSHDDVLRAAETLILSASGWRKVFAAGGNEESRTADIGAADKIIAGIAALVLTEYVRSRDAAVPLVICTGCDARPSGPAVMDVMHRIFIALNVEVHSLFISAAPELMASVKLDERVDGFAYITASHNPIGHNGLKFGGVDGAVFGGAESAELITRFRETLADPYIVERITGLSKTASPVTYTELLEKIPARKHHALKRYQAFTYRVVSGAIQQKHQDTFFKRLTSALDRNSIGIVGELNGSARGTSIDHDFLSTCGFIVDMHNDIPGNVVHRIVPEGESLDLCRELLLKKYRQNSAFILGYVPDNDGDRGNIVYINTAAGRAETIDAQEVFALVVLSELAYQDYLAEEDDQAVKKAVVVNGPTSMRIERIARVFDAEVYRAEVGEANAVHLAEQLRKDGFSVRILGEGSNGGNITHPATVRDPLNTIFSLVKLIVFTGRNDPSNLFARWCRKSASPLPDQQIFSLHEVIDSLPAFITTSAYEAEAIMRIRSTDHAGLKLKYENIFLEEWDRKKDFLRAEYGIHTWREVNYEGVETKAGFGPGFRTGGEKGGLKIIFSNLSGEDTDFLWMRGSGTEPVFRVLADTAGNDQLRHDWLLQWHRGMIERADSC